MPKKGKVQSSGVKAPIVTIGLLSEPFAAQGKLRLRPPIEEGFFGGMLDAPEVGV